LLLNEAALVDLAGLRRRDAREVVRLTILKIKEVGASMVGVR
jgi:hypothetical protein